MASGVIYIVPLAKFAAGHMGTALAEAMVQIPREQQDAVLALARALAKGA